MNDKETISQGVYVGMIISSESKAKLEKFCAQNSIEIDFSSNQFEKDIHTTIIFSPTGQSDKVARKEISVSTKASHWTVFKSLMTGNECLILKLHSAEIQKLHKEMLSEHELSHLYETYQPHITLSYRYNKGVLPEKVPDFEISFDSMYIRTLIHKKTAAPQLFFNNPKKLRIYST